MSKGVNKVILVGRLGKEPAHKKFDNGSSVTNFSIATSENWKDKDSGEKKEVTEWHNIVAHGRLAEICAEYLHKGSQVYLEGQLKTRKYTDKSGVERFATEIIAKELQMLDGKKDAATANASNEKPVNTQKDMDFDDGIPF